MNRFRSLLGALVLASLAGCGGSQPPLNTTPLTDEQKAAIKKEDAAIDAEESPNNKAAKIRPKGK
jgi:predicted small lipoprotein YifL